ncbi:MAG: carbohydrate ABC transporter permease [Lachnospiraceae bacterium]|nr:carbohydrate ABC transporter permease [Lachnospiraceae bacterium]
MKKEKNFSFSKLLIYLSLCGAALVSMIPILVVFIGSLKTNDELMNTGVLELPRNPLNFSNYVTAFIDGKMLLGFANTSFILLFSIVATILTGTMTAYVLNRFKFKGKGIIASLFLVASLVPSITMQMSTFQIIVGMHLFDTIWSTIILFAGTDIISIYIFVQFLENISTSLDEAAIVDGASYFTVFSKILMPLLKPAIVTVLILKGVTFYNEFYTPYLYMPSNKLAVISTALFRFKGPYNTRWEVICAGIIITMLPALIVFLLLQKSIYNGLTAGSIKE